MPDIDGLEAAHHLRKIDSRVIIIFITNFLDCAIAGYAVEALGFIPKPANYTNIQIELRKAMRHLSPNAQGALQIHLSDGLYIIQTRDIFYIETEGRRLLLHTKNSLIPYAKSMVAVEKELAGQSFFRCHTSYLINLYYVERLRENTVQVQGDVLPVSRQRYKDFRKALIRYFRGKAKV